MKADKCKEINLKNEPCGVSTGICERLTFGRGKIDFYGYWEFPDYEAARNHEKLHPKDGECWPSPKNSEVK